MEHSVLGTDVAQVRKVPVGDAHAPDITQRCIFAQDQEEDFRIQDNSSTEMSQSPPRSRLNDLPLVMSEVVIVQDGSAFGPDTEDTTLLSALNKVCGQGSECQYSSEQEPGLRSSDADMTVPVTVADEPLNEYGDNNVIFACGFPHLFPFGPPPSMPKGTFPEDLTRYLMLHHDGRFAAEIPLVFLLFN